MYLVFLATITLLEITLGLVVIFKNHRGKSNLALAGIILFAALWSVFNYLSDHPIVPNLALWWNRLTFSVAFLEGAFLLFFASVFPFSMRRLERICKVLVLPLAVGLAIVSALTSGIVSRVEFLNWGTNAEPGAIYGSFIGFMSITVIGTLIILIIKYRRALGLEKYQLKYLFTGFLLTAVIALTTNLFLPLVAGNNQLAKFGPLSMVFLIVFTFYAIVRHRLMDIRIVLKKTLLHVAVSLVMLAFILGAIFTVAHFLMKRIPDYSLVFTGSIAMVVALLFLNPLNRFFERIANRYFFTSLYNYQATLEELAQGLTAVIEIHKVIDLIVGTIIRAMGLDRAGVLLLSPEKNSKRYIIAKVIGFNEKNGISLVRDNFLVQWLSQNRKMIIFEELQRLIEESSRTDERSKLMRLKTNMNKIEASLCIPLFSKDTLISIIVLGSKVTRDPYTSEDLRLLQTIANQASISVQNARLYAQIQDFSLTLQEKVHEQTRDIKEKNERLQELLKMKSEFLSIASHQLRTPLTAIRGLLSMQADGDFDSYPQEKIHEQQKHMLESANRLSNIVNDLLDAMELEGGNLKFQFKNVQLEDMIKEICSDLLPNYERKGLYLKVEKSKKPIPQIEIEPKMFHEALENLIDNAEKYTNKGGTVITLFADASNATIIVRDTGIGIPKSDFPKLFQKFSRGEKSSYQHTDGSGLGLFIAKNVFTEHHGKIDVTSPGEGKGTTVTITIPLKQPQTQGKI